jgi:hypothetical protein
VAVDSIPDDCCARWSSAARLLFGHSGARLQQVDEPDTQEHGDRRDRDGVDERLDADATELADVAETGHAQSQSRHQERDHQHEQKPEENLSDRSRDVAYERLEAWIPRELPVREEPSTMPPTPPASIFQ